MKARVAKKVIDARSAGALHHQRRTWSSAHQRWTRYCRRAVMSGVACGSPGRRSDLLWQTIAMAMLAAVKNPDGLRNLIAEGGVISRFVRLS